MGDEGDEGRSPLIDVSGLSLRQLETLGETPLREELSELLGTPGEVAAAGFDAFMPTE